MSRRVCMPAVSWIVLLCAVFSSRSLAEVQTEVRTFPASPGDRIKVQNDLGRVRIRAWDAPEVKASIERVSAAGLTGEFRVSSGKSGREILLHSFFSGQSSEVVNLDIQAPKFVEISVAGSFVEVDIQGIEGSVHVNNISGSVLLDGVTSAVTVSTVQGDIRYHPQVQPRADVHLESTGGTIRCELPEKINVRGSLRTGGAILWGRDGAVRDAALEKTLGSAGPLLEVRSTKGDIRVSVGTVAEAESSVPLPSPATPVPAPVTPAQAVPRRSTDAAVLAPPVAPPAPAPDSRSGQDRFPQQSPTARPASEATVAAPADGGSVAIKVAVDSVLLNLSVLDRASNRTIPGLQREDFVVHENGVLQDVQDLLPAEAPFSLLLLMDVSGSTTPYINLMRNAASDFLRQLKENDRVAVASFSSRVQLLQDFTSDRNAASRAISRLQPGGGTAFYDALWDCVDRYMRGIEGRKAIVVFTDGVDNQLLGNRADGSRTSFEQLYRRVQEVDTIVYTIFLDSEEYTRTMTRGQRRYPGGGYPGGGYPPLGRSRFPLPIPMPSPSPSPPPPRIPGQRGANEGEAYEIAREQLETIAEQTGGRMYSPQRAEDLSEVYAEIAADLRIQYLLSYASSNTGDGWRAIRVTVKDHPEAAVRTRKGYYARKSG